MSKLSEIQDEIDDYRLPKKIADAMLALGKLGFEFSGHGTNLITGKEDFALDKNYRDGYVTVNFRVGGRVTDVEVSVWTKRDAVVSFRSTLGKVVNMVCGHKLHIVSGFRKIIADYR